LRNFTGDYLEAYRPKIDYSKFWHELEDARWFREGADDKDAKATIYGFFDANCGFCHVGWLGLKPYMNAGLQVRWIPVAVIGLDSDKKAAALMTAGNPVATMEAGHAGWAEKQGDAFPSADVTPEVRQALDRHADLMRRVGATGTPAFLYKDSTGAVKLVPGVIRLADIPGITGISEIENKDPRLDNFR
jgi:thiol:disulfide interchange protein DsbG